MCLEIHFEVGVQHSSQESWSCTLGRGVSSLNWPHFNSSPICIARLWIIHDPIDPSWSSRQCPFQLTKVLIFLTQINCTIAAITTLVMVEIEESHDRNANISLICENIFTEHEAGKADKGEIICWSSQSCERRRPIMLLSVGPTTGLIWSQCSP